MSLSSDLTHTDSHAKLGFAIEGIRRQLRQLPIFVRIAAGVYWSLLIITFSIISAARTEKLTHIVEPPANTLPGNLVPDNIPCDSTTYSQRYLCRFGHDGEMGYLVIDNGTPPRIVRVTITAHRHTLGNLIASWGVPSGAVRSGISITVFWDRRWAYINTCSLSPNNLVEFIGYGHHDASPIPQTVLPWRGFTNRLDYGCSPGIKGP